jgi:hypothetical protein
MTRFDCTPAGAVLAGRRRLKLYLLGLSGLSLLVALAAWIFLGRFWPGFFAVLVALVPATAWRLGSNVDLLWLEVGGGELVVRMRWRLERFSLATASARRLTPDEIRHVQGLATSAGIVTGNAGFESHLLGDINLYASNLENAVLVELDDETRVVVTPDDVEGFVGAMGQQAS